MRNKKKIFKSSSSLVYYEPKWKWINWRIKDKKKKSLFCGSWKSMNCSEYTIAKFTHKQMDNWHEQGQYLFEDNSGLYIMKFILNVEENQKE